MALLMSVWWAVMGLLFVGFGYGFFRAFSCEGKHARPAAWMIAIYGLGEGLGSSLVPETPGMGFRTVGNLVHILLGATGVLAAIFLPFIVMKVFTSRKWPRLYCYSWLTSATGIFFILLFAVSYLYKPVGGWLSYCGLWQRLFMLVYYLFYVCLALLMLTHRKCDSRTQDSGAWPGASLRS